MKKTKELFQLDTALVRPVSGNGFAEYAARDVVLRKVGVECGDFVRIFLEENQNTDFYGEEVVWVEIKSEVTDVGTFVGKIISKVSNLSGYKKGDVVYGRIDQFNWRTLAVPDTYKFSYEEYEQK